MHSYCSPRLTIESHYIYLGLCPMLYSYNTLTPLLHKSPQTCFSTYVKLSTQKQNNHFIANHLPQPKEQMHLPAFVFSLKGKCSLSARQSQCFAHIAKGKMDWDKQLAVSTTVVDENFNLTNQMLMILL